MILFDGCSYTYGDELQGTDDDHDYRVKNRFSHVVAEELGDNYVNFGESGKSNDGILRTTLDYCENHKVDLAIIQFTAFSRFECQKEDKKDYWYITPQGGKEISKIYYQYFENINNSAANYHKNKFLLENYFKSKKIKYFFMKLQRDRDIKGFIPSSWYNLVDKTPIMTIRELISSRRHKPENFCKRYVAQPRFQGGHPNKQGHKRIAEYILENL